MLTLSFFLYPFPPALGKHILLAISWGVDLCVRACVCTQSLINPLPWFFEVGSGWDLWREEGYKRVKQETLVPGFSLPHSGDPQRPLSPDPSAPKPIVLPSGL